MELPSYVKSIMDKLEAAGYEVYAVGGCVRDAFIAAAESGPVSPHSVGTRIARPDSAAVIGDTGDRPEPKVEPILSGGPGEPGDYDLATNALPETVMEIFGAAAHPTGLKHGTVTVALEGQAVEITTYRADGPYTDKRHPDSVRFVRDIRADLARRDFTINAMAFHPTQGLMDPFGGAEDLQKGLIRAVGVPEARFEEDGLRILRGLRFAATLDFEIENETARALRQCAPLLAHVARERIGVEFIKLLRGRGAARVLGGYPAVFAYVLPHLGPAQNLSLLPPDPLMRLTLLLLPDAPGAGEAELAAAAEMACKSLRLRSADCVQAARLCAICEMPLTEKALLQKLRRLPMQTLREGLVVREAKYGKSATLAEAHAILTRLEDSNACLRLADLAIDGTTVAALGLRGRAVGECLSALLLACAMGKLENEPAALLKAAQLFVKDNFNE